MTRYFPMGCGSDWTIRRWVSGRMASPRNCPQAMKNCCSGVKPSIVGAGVAGAEKVDYLLDFAILNHPAQANIAGIGEWNHDLKAAGLNFQEVEPLYIATYNAAADLLDNTYAMVGINDFVAYLKVEFSRHKTILTFRGARCAGET